MKAGYLQAAQLSQAHCLIAFSKTFDTVFFFPSRGSEVLECKCFSLLCVISSALIFNSDSLLLIILVRMNTWPWHTHAWSTSAGQSSHCGIPVWLFWLLNDHGGSQKCHNKAESSLKFMQCFCDAVHLKGHPDRVVRACGRKCVVVLSAKKC